MPRPKVSICVTAYNSDKYLEYFLDSAVNQTFDDLEIVLVDNLSTDSTWTIMKKYAEAFPEKVFAFQTDEHGFASKGRNLAFQKSRGSYVYMCDADDLLRPRAIEKLYEEAEKYDADIVCGAAMLVTEENGEIVSIASYHRKRTMQVHNETDIKGGVEYWFRLYKRSLLEQVGPIPEEGPLDDVRYVTILCSYAKVIRHTEYLIYYYFKRSGVDTITSAITEEFCREAISASQYALYNSNPQYIEAVQYKVANRAVWGLTGRWQLYDLFVDEIKGYIPWIYSNKQIRNDRRLLDRLRMAERLADIHFPNIIYVDGFAAAPSEERLTELREKVFHDGCEIVALSPESCDIDENEYVKRAYDRGDLALVTSYFALKSIYDNGGVFIHNNIRILEYFSYLKYQNAFFALLDKTTYSEWIYGAPAGNEAIAAILKTYSDAWDKKGEYMPLSERISIILTAKYGIPLDGKARLFQEVVSVISPDMSVVDTRFGDATKKRPFEHDFSAYAGEASYATLPRSTLRLLMTQTAAGPSGKSARERALEKELADMKQTNTYKMMMKIRAIGDGPHGPFLKKIFHGMLRMRKKLKTGGRA